MERSAEEGEGPVDERWAKVSGILSTAGHEESGRKQAGPSVKAKYHQVSDSEQVP